MENVDRYRDMICLLLRERAKIPYSHGDMHCQPVFDRDNDSYLLVTQGWDGKRRVHGIVIHIDVIAGKIWVQRDSTNVSIVQQLEEAGVPKDHIVLGFRPAHVRPLTDYAVA
jgi:hypothetical protein